jgi:hypothetical protein
MTHNGSLLGRWRCYWAWKVRNLFQDIANYIDGILQREEGPLKVETVLSVVSSKLKELEDDIEAEQ